MVKRYELTLEGETFVVEVGDVSQSPVTVIVNGTERTVSFRDLGMTAPRETGAPAVPAAPAESAGERPAPEPEVAAEPAPAATTVPAGSVEGEVVVAPMPGKILSVAVGVGDSVAQGDTVCTLEAMKMEMPIASTAGGTVQAVHVAVGDNVANDAPLVTIG